MYLYVVAGIAVAMAKPGQEMIWFNPKFNIDEMMAAERQQ